MLEVKVKYLQYLIKKNKNQGFTLIELLIVVIILGILAAIALPSFLSQAANARSAEGKSMMAAINRSQQAYRMEYSTFAPTVDALSVGTSGNLYQYSTLGSVSSTFVEHRAVPKAGQKDLKIYASAVKVANGILTQGICESKQLFGDGGDADIGSDMMCDSTSKLVK